MEFSLKCEALFYCQLLKRMRLASALQVILHLGYVPILYRPGSQKITEDQQVAYRIGAGDFPQLLW